MLEAGVLKIMPIGNFEVYYRAHTRGTTSLSIRIDGLTIYTLDVPGYMKPASGKDTVGAFQNADKRSLVAWIDPISGEYITSDRTVYDSLLTIPFLTILAIFVTEVFHQTRFVVLPLFGVSIIWAAIRVVRGRKNNSALESLLRSQFRKGTS
jgi:hypothetical protein